MFHFIHVSKLIYYVSFILVSFEEQSLNGKEVKFIFLFLFLCFDVLSGNHYLIQGHKGQKHPFFSQEFYSFSCYI